uniref:L-lactate dehydrogenase n=1 Tax=Syphacia muris TaxID=451379 RepID=A0A0N5ASE6_9BILA
MDATMKAMFHEVASAHTSSRTKITVVGVGQVGMACAYSILQQNIAGEICLIDVDENKLKGEMMDLQDGLAFTRHCIVKASKDYAITKDSNVCIITAGARQREGEDRLSLGKRNVAIFKGIVPNLVKYSPDTILMVVSNPVDVLTFLTWRISGLPSERVIGSGTNLDSARFRFLLSDRLKIASSSCHAWIIGEHGDSSVPVWSGVNVAGVRLDDLDEKTEVRSKEWRKNIHNMVVKSAGEIIKLKGYTSWAIGLSCATIVSGILRNTRNVFALSTNVKGLHGITEDVYLSLPCVLGENGVTHVVKQHLNNEEVQKLRASAKVLLDAQKSIEI